MNAALLAFGSLAFLFLGYRFYARYIAQKIYQTESPVAESEILPSEELNDGVDYVPTNRFVLFGHHFASIAGAAPILGPAIAIIWGWLPALLWVVFGTIFIGAVHDYGALVISARHKGQSIGGLTGSILSIRARYLFLIIIFILVFIVLAVFAYLIAKLFIAYPGSVIPINFEIIVALAMGWWINRRKGSLLIPSLIALFGLYFMIWVGYHNPIHIPETFWLGGSEIMTWIVLLMIYGMFASIMPVWLLLQPRDYINSHKLILGLALIYTAIFIAQPVVDAPMTNFENTSVSWFPFLFITIACGAISGFHSLVSSGTSSKQLAKMTHARSIGYGGMVGEATLAIAATIAVAAGFSGSEAWHAHYADFDAANSGALGAYVSGTASFLPVLGIPPDLGAVFISVMVISFAATSLDTAVRIQRFVIGEIGEGLKISSLQSNRYLQSFLAVFFSMLLIISSSDGEGGFRLWPLFGSTNQMVGSLTLLVISVWLLKQKRNYWITLIPMIFITVVTFVGTIAQFIQYIEGDQWLLVSMAAIIGICQILIIIEGFSIFRKIREESD